MVFPHLYVDSACLKTSVIFAFVPVVMTPVEIKNHFMFKVDTSLTDTFLIQPEIHIRGPCILRKARMCVWVTATLYNSSSHAVDDTHLTE